MQSNRIPWFLAAAATLAVVVAAFAGEAPGGRYSLDVEVSPAAEPAGAFEARARVTDLATEELLAAPRVLFLRGEEAMMRSGNTLGFQLDIVVKVDEAGTSATYEAKLQHDGAVVSRQRVTVTLGGAAE